ncbi:uncharacterized protein BDV17DRAFT_250590 [Aspergillus undulatus]|uniref:uncharacterized protein n=1 Tax=Aspergillus undulatus TaxID=1810928 RepID=UPI003CCCFCD4
MGRVSKGILVPWFLQCCCVFPYWVQLALYVPCAVFDEVKRHDFTHRSVGALTQHCSLMRRAQRRESVDTGIMLGEGSDSSLGVPPAVIPTKRRVEDCADSVLESPEVHPAMVSPGHGPKPAGESDGQAPDYERQTPSQPSDATNLRYDRAKRPIAEHEYNDVSSGAHSGAASFDREKKATAPNHYQHRRPSSRPRQAIRPTTTMYQDFSITLPGAGVLVPRPVVYRHSAVALNPLMGSATAVNDNRYAIPHPPGPLYTSNNHRSAPGTMRHGPKEAASAAQSGSISASHVQNSAPAQPSISSKKKIAKPASRPVNQPEPSLPAIAGRPGTIGADTSATHQENGERLAYWADQALCSKTQSQGMPGQPGQISGSSQSNNRASTGNSYQGMANLEHLEQSRILRSSSVIIGGS